MKDYLRSYFIILLSFFWQIILVLTFAMNAKVKSLQHKMFLKTHWIIKRLPISNRWVVIKKCSLSVVFRKVRMREQKVLPYKQGYILQAVILPSQFKSSLTSLMPTNLGNQDWLRIWKCGSRILLKDVINFVSFLHTHIYIWWGSSFVTSMQ